jgi:hypothetical protein
MNVVCQKKKRSGNWMFPSSGKMKVALILLGPSVTEKPQSEEGKHIST